MYTHNPPERFSLVTRAESTCVERCEPSKLITPSPPSEASSGSRSIFRFEISWGPPQPSTSTRRSETTLPTVEQRLTQLLPHQSCTCRLCEAAARVQPYRVYLIASSWRKSIEGTRHRAAR